MRFSFVMCKAMNPLALCNACEPVVEALSTNKGKYMW